MNKFDRLVLLIMVGLVAVIGAVVALGDRAGATIHAITPEDNSTPPVTSTITVTFAQPMDAQSVQAHFRIEPEIDGSFAWEGTTLRFRPSRVFEAGQRYSVTVESGAVSLQGRATTRPVTSNFTPRSPAILFVAPVNSDVRSLWRVAAAGGEPAEIYKPDYGVFDFAASHDGERLAVTTFNQDMTSDIWLMKSDGRGTVAITDCAPASCRGPTWSPDGTLLAYERQDASATGAPGPSRIWLYDTLNEETAPVYQDNQVLGYGAKWSPDGERIAFFDASSHAIRVVPLAGGDAAVIPSDMGEIGSFSPDGTQMVFADIRPVGQQFFTALWLADFDPDGGLSMLVDEPEEDRSPAWAPNSPVIAFGRRRLDRQGGFASQLVLFNTETGEFREVTDDPSYNNTGFSWSPTGEQLVVQRFNLDQMQAVSSLWIFDVQDGTMEQIINDGFGAAWLP